MTFETVFDAHNRVEMIFVGNFPLRIKKSFRNHFEQDFYVTNQKISSETAARAKSGKVLYTERITILGTELLGFETEGGFDRIFADVRVRAVEYVADIKTRKRLSGSAEEQFMTVRVVLRRETGRVSPQLTGISAQNCPYCGAPVNINKSSKCDYCGRVLNTDSFDWLIESAEIH